MQWYYGEVITSGYDEQDVEITKKTISYLLDCNLRYIEVVKVLRALKIKRITPDELPDNLWANSLIKRNAFYLHKELVLTSPAPTVDFRTGEIKSKPFYYEVKIKYTTNDVVDYFYNRLQNTGRLLADRKTDLKTVSFLMKKYAVIDYVEPLDIILCSIDNHLELYPDTYQLIAVTNTNQEVITELMQNMQELMCLDKRKIVWR